MACLRLAGTAIDSTDLRSCAPALRKLVNLRHLGLPTRCLSHRIVSITPAFALESLSLSGPSSTNTKLSIETVEWLLARSEPSLRQVRLTHGCTFDMLGRVRAKTNEAPQIHLIVNELQVHDLAWSRTLQTAELLIHILSYLDQHSLGRTSRVNKLWLDTSTVVRMPSIMPPAEAISRGALEWIAVQLERRAELSHYIRRWSFDQPTYPQLTDPSSQSLSAAVHAVVHICRGITAIGLWSACPSGRFVRSARSLRRARSHRLADARFIAVVADVHVTVDGLALAEAVRQSHAVYGLCESPLDGRVVGQGQLSAFGPVLRGLPGLDHLRLPPSCLVKFDCLVEGHDSLRTPKSPTFVAPLEVWKHVSAGSLSWLLDNVPTSLRRVRLVHNRTASTDGTQHTAMPDLQLVVTQHLASTRAMAMPEMLLFVLRHLDQPDLARTSRASKLWLDASTTARMSTVMPEAEAIAWPALRWLAKQLDGRSELGH